MGFSHIGSKTPQRNSGNLVTAVHKVMVSQKEVIDRVNKLDESAVWKELRKQRKYAIIWRVVFSISLIGGLALVRFL